MKSYGRLMVLAALVFSITGVAAADTLELKDGRVLQGRYLGGTQAVLRFEVNGEVQTFSVTTVVAVTFTGPSHSAAVEAAPAANPAPRGPDPSRMAPTPAPEGSTISVAAGTPLLVRMIDGVDSSKNHVGDIFHASLETDLVVNDQIVARKGSDVYGRLAEAKEAGHLAGAAELQLELTRIVIDGRDFPIVSSDYATKGKGRGTDTAKKVGGGAAIGAVIGAIAGGGAGAAIGAGVGSAAGAGVQIVTKGQQVKVPSETLLEFRLQQPVTLVASAQNEQR